MKTIDACLRRLAKRVLDQLSNRELDRRDAEISIDAMIATLRTLGLVKKHEFLDDVRVWLANADLKKLLSKLCENDNEYEEIAFDEEGDETGLENDGDEDVYPCLVYCASETQRPSPAEEPKKKSKRADA